MLRLIPLLLCACRDKAAPSPEDTGEPEVFVPGSGQLSFREATAGWGLAKVHSTGLVVGDLDGDGYPDLVGVDNGGIDTFAEGDPRYHFVLMNRSDGGGGRRFVDETEASGLYARRSGEGARPAGTPILADLDGDGDLDAFIAVNNDPHTDPATHWSDRSDVMLNDGEGHFSFADSSPDLQVDMMAIGTTLTDADADGNVDLYLAQWYQNIDLYGDGSWLNWVFGEENMLLLGKGDGRFTDRSEAAGIVYGASNSTSKVLNGKHARPSMGSSACDLDADGLPELLAMSYGRQWNEHWRNEGGTFVEVGAESGYAGDDNIDYTDNWYYQCTCWSQGTCEKPTDPDFPYSKSQCSQVAAGGYWNPGWDDQPANLNGNTFSTVCADLDNDGDLDLVNGEITHQWAGLSSDLSAILLNDGAGIFSRPDPASTGFSRTPVKSPDYGSWDFGDQKVAVADLDNDGWKDILIMSGAAYYGNVLSLFRQSSPLFFEEVQDAVGIAVPTAHGIAIADFDRDGDLDFVASSLSELLEGSTTDHRVYFFENQGTTNHFLRIALSGGPGNRSGVGARVTVRTGEREQVQEVVAGAGQGGMQQDVVLHFGLGARTTVDEVEVAWIGAPKETFTGITADTQVRLSTGGQVDRMEP